MANRSKRVCPHPGCHTLTDGGRCPKHKQEQNRVNNAAREGEHDKLYNTKQWKQYRRQWLRRFPLCGMRVDGRTHSEHSVCALNGEATPGTDVDHIKAHRGDPALAFDDNNMQTLCKRCHARKTGKEVRAREANYERDAEAAILDTVHARNAKQRMSDAINTAAAAFAASLSASRAGKNIDVTQLDSTADVLYRTCIHAPLGHRGEYVCKECAKHEHIDVIVNGRTVHMPGLLKTEMYYSPQPTVREGDTPQLPKEGAPAPTVSQHVHVIAVAPDVPRQIVDILRRVTRKPG